MKRKQKLNELLTGLCVTFDREFQPVMVDVWDTALADLAIEEIDRAASRWVAVVGKRFPVPAEIREIILGDSAANATLALETLKNAMRRTGSYRSVAFADPALIVAIEHHGDWVEICRSYRDLRDQDVSYWEHNFKQIYQQSVKSGRQPSVRHLMGITEMQNSAGLGRFTRGVLPEPEVDFYGSDQKPKRLPLSAINPNAQIVQAQQKQLAEAELRSEEGELAPAGPRAGDLSGRSRRKEVTGEKG